MLSTFRDNAIFALRFLLQVFVVDSDLFWPIRHCLLKIYKHTYKKIFNRRCKIKKNKKQKTKNKITASKIVVRELSLTKQDTFEEQNRETCRSSTENCLSNFIATFFRCITGTLRRSITGTLRRSIMGTLRRSITI
jgi:hypothetical protein